jgi:hypothetical protein
VGGSTTAQLWLSNGWDRPGSPKDTHIGGRVQQAIGEVATLGLSGTYGAFADEYPKLMLDLDVALTFGILRIGAQLDYGRQDELDSIGALLSVNVALSSRVSVTGRFDYLDREITDSAYKGSSVTLAGLFNLTKGFDVIAEVRTDLPDGEDTIVTGALEVLASF